MKRGNLFRILYFLIYATGASFFPYINLYYRQAGMSGTQIGLLASMAPLVMLFTQPLWGIISDVTEPKKVLLLLLGMGMLVPLGYLRFSGFWPFLFLGFTFFFFRSPLPAITDSLVLEHIESQGGSYGNLRLWGAVGWSSLSLIIGQIIQSAGLRSIFYATCLGTAIAFTIVSRMKYQRSLSRREKRTDGFFRNLGQLLKNRQLVIFLSLVFLLHMATASIWSFLAIYLDIIHTSRTLMGIAFMMEGLSEIPLYLLAGKISRRWGLKITLVISFFLYSLRMSLYSFIRTPALAIAVQGLHGPGFALFLVSSVEYVNRQTPRDFRTTGQSLFWAVFFGLASIVGNNLAGIIFDRAGIFRLYLFSGAVGLLATSLAILLLPPVED